MFDKETDSGVSPVIGVILMVAVTVALVALVTVVVFDLGGDVSDSPDATVQLEEESGNVQATLLRNENVQELYLSDGTNSWGDTDAQGTLNNGNYESPMQNAGDTISTSGNSDQASDDGSTGVNDSASLSSGDTVNVIAVMPDGNEEVLTSTDL